MKTEVYYWITTRKSQERAMYGSARGLQEDEVPRILLHHLIDRKDGEKAVSELLKLRPLERFLRDLEHDYKREDFLSHFRRYVDMWRTECPFEINTTNRYTKLHDEASVTARKVIGQGEVIKYMSGTLVEITMEEEAELRRAKRDFSVVFMSRKKRHKMFLGPARFANHDCRPNARLDATKNAEAMQVVALRELLPGEEITVDYGPNYFGHKNCECLCATCALNHKGNWLSKDDPTSASRGRAGRETARPPSPRPIQLAVESSQRGRRRSRSHSGTEGPPNKRQKTGRLPLSPPPSHSSNAAEHSSLASRGSDQGPASQSPGRRSPRTEAEEEQAETPPLRERHVKIVGEDSEPEEGRGDGIQQNHLTRKFPPYIPTPSPVPEIPETPPPQPAREPSPQLPITMPFWPGEKRIANVNITDITPGESPQVAILVDPADTDTTETSPAPDSSRYESDGSDMADDELEEDSIVSNGFFARSLTPSTGHESDANLQKGASPERDASLERDTSPPAIIPPAELGRTSRSTSVASNGSSTSEESPISRYPGDHYRTAACLTMPDSRWVECRTCGVYWVQRSGRDTHRECPRCERHSKVYGFGWPKTDPVRSRHPGRLSARDLASSQAKEETAKTEKENRLWRGWTTVPTEDEVRIMDPTFIKRHLSRAEEREQIKKGKGLLKPGEVDQEPSRKPYHEAAQDAYSHDDSNSDSESSSPQKRRRLRDAPSRSTEHCLSSPRVKRASAIAAQDNWLSNSRIRRDGTLNLGKSSMGFGTRRRRRNSTSESPKKTSRATLMQGSTSESSEKPSASSAGRGKLCRVTKRGQITKPRQTTTKVLHLPRSGRPNKAPLTRPGVKLAGLAARKTTASGPGKKKSSPPPLLSVRSTGHGRKVSVPRRKVGRPLGSTKKPLK